VGVYGKPVKRKSDFILQNVGGENLLVPIGAQVLDTNGLITLNATGRCLWELLAQDCSPEDLAGALTERFDVDIQRARADVQVFIDEVSRIGILDESPDLAQNFSEPAAASKGTLTKSSPQPER
jgi:hypothetical protein